MKHLNLNQIREFANNNIAIFQELKLKPLENLNLNIILNNKNFYWYKANRIYSASDLIRKVFGDFLTSLEEHLFELFLKDLCVFISKKAYNGKKSSFNGIDIEFENNNIYYLVSINSGFNPINNIQQKIDFQKAIKKVNKDGYNRNIKPVMGICFGKSNTESCTGCTKIVGTDFWYFISENNKLFTDIIDPLANTFYKDTETLYNRRIQLENKFTAQILNEYSSGGAIDWRKLVKSAEI